MNSEVLDELVLIRWLLVAIFFAIFLAVLFVVTTIALRIRQANTQALLQHRDNMLAELTLLEAKGKYQEMLVEVESVLRAYPNDLMANWYAAIANYRTGNLGAALSALGQIKQINSVWGVESVDAFIEEIKSEMGGPRAGDA